MMLTIEWKTVKDAIEIVLDEYGGESRMIQIAVTGGQLVGMLNLAQLMTGVPEDEIQALRERVNGIGELKRNGINVKTSHH